MSLRRQRLIPLVGASSALALGVVTLTGWALQSALLVQIRPEWTPVVVNTAIGFVLGALGLIAATLPARLPRQVAQLFGFLLVLLAVEELAVPAFDLSPAFSLPDVHRAMQPDNPHPGRMAPNTALAFLLFGASLVGWGRSAADSAPRWVQHGAAAVMLIAFLGVMGFSLRLEYLYGWTGAVRMALQTGVGLLIMGAGLWKLVEDSAARQILHGREVLAVKRTAAVLMLLVAVAAGVGSFTFLQAQLEEHVHDELGRMVLDRIAMFDLVIADRGTRSRIVAGDDQLAPQLRALARSPVHASTPEAVQAWAAHLAAIGFSSVTAEVAGRRWQLQGTPATPSLSLPLKGSTRGRLLWQDGYLLQVSEPVRDAEGWVGVLVTEQRLDSLTALGQAGNRLGQTGELGVCGPVATGMSCFPLRSRPRPFDLPLLVAGQPLPLARALRGETGSIIAFDFRHQRVLAAYGPIGGTGLGMVVKRDVTELYAPIRVQLQRIVVFLVALLLFGQWLMRRRLRPLLHAMETSRAQALADGARFQAAVESHLDAFIIMDAMRDPLGRIVDFRCVLTNGPAEFALNRPRAELLGKDMCDLFPEMRDNGLLENYARVVESGEPMIEERASVVRKDRWYQVQAVRLNDGVALTIRDVTAAREAVERIQHQAMHDPLTGLANRASFELELATALAEARVRGHTTALLLLDLDDFKQINDSLGHAAGDQLLQEVARRLSACVRPSDLVVRLGGDEFVLLLPKVSYPDGVEIVARKLVADVRRPMNLDGHAVQVTASLGISACPHDGCEPTILLKRADVAMYQAKNAGRNRYMLFDTGASKP